MIFQINKFKNLFLLFGIYLVARIITYNLEIFPVANELGLKWQLFNPKLLKENFEDCYKKALSEVDNLDDSVEAIPSPGQIVDYIERLPEAEQAKALAIVNDWFDNLED